MVRPKVILSVATANLPDEKYEFDKPTECTLGRGSDCNIRFPGSVGHADVSRHHCMLEIDPPDVQVRDLGSRNGTFVNGEKIGQRPEFQSPDDVDSRAFAARGLHDGDVLKIGHTEFRVEIDDPARPSTPTNHPEE